MADDADAVAPKMMRPNDLCTAAFYGDVDKMKELLTVEAVEEEPPIDPEFDPLAPVDEEVAANAADRAARRATNVAEITKRLSTTRRIVTRLSPVNIQEYGMFLTATETYNEALGTFELHCRVKSSKRSHYDAAPLHWAVLGREHAAVTFLIMQGAKVDQVIPGLNMTIADIIRVNELQETRKVVDKALEAYKEVKEKEHTAASERARILEEREEQRHRAQEEVRRKEEEERLEAERATEQEAEGAAVQEEAAPEEQDGDA
jgi:flagellar biosynthesis GTPase FlhF